MTSKPEQYPASRPPSLGSACAGTIVTIIVGAEQKKRSIHKTLLIHHSEYFRKALSGPWKEAEEGVVRLEDVDLATVDVFIHWLYTGQVPNATDHEAWILVTGEDYTNLFTVLNSAYTFADRVMVPELQRILHNSLVDYILDWLDGSVPYDRFDTLLWAEEAFKSMRDDRPVLQLIVDKHFEFCFGSCCDEGPELISFPPGFLARLARRLWLLHENADRPGVYGERCYHEHADVAGKAACGKLHMCYTVELGVGIFGHEGLCERCTSASLENDTSSSEESAKGSQ